ncbi:MAG: hypothetical protein HOK06_09265 [Rhodospirillaceae bacterium]|jgi:hypothetical protein|nr:hypothetical protein [Rhodospirillaceae bacterium]MBT4219014.1 hypothetical protein [Rhodospirillaceae bacterium]MBT4463505.1 hypothetical protein [Rhodospirillaceae bacterium]MBT5013894.1 hypothetical protein [Rhodospirillaceae bacterium]MBT5308222.1 hypothetical protein [Rhodospirillaceae bacterium]
MLLNAAPVDYQRNLALYGASLMAVPPTEVITPPKREVDEPDAMRPKTRQPPVYEKRHGPRTQTHPVAAIWHPPAPQAASPVHTQALPDIAGAISMQAHSNDAGAHHLDIPARHVVSLYQPHAEPPQVSVELSA